MAASTGKQLLAEIALVTEKIKAQVPVTAAELRSLWYDLLANMKAMAVPAPGLTKAEIKEGIAAFKAPDHEPSFIEVKSSLHEIVKHFNENGCRIDTSLAAKIHSYSGDPNGVIENPEECKRAMEQGAREIRVAWHRVLEGMIKNYFMVTAGARVLIPECSLMEPDFQGWLDYCDDYLQVSIATMEFARRLTP